MLLQAKRAERKIIIVDQRLGVVLEQCLEWGKFPYFLTNKKTKNEFLNSKNGFKDQSPFLVFTFMQAVVIAQEETSARVTKTTTTTSNTWYAEPWVWVVGGAVVILILVALLRGGGSSSSTTGRTDQVTVTKTSSTDI